MRSDREQPAHFLPLLRWNKFSNVSPLLFEILQPGGDGIILFFFCYESWSPWQPATISSYANFVWGLIGLTWKEWANSPKPLSSFHSWFDILLAISFIFSIAYNKYTFYHISTKYIPFPSFQEIPVPFAVIMFEGKNSMTFDFLYYLAMNLFGFFPHPTTCFSI